jgi:hypothetical protein
MCHNTKPCSYCKEEKELDFFSRNKNCMDGYDVRCKNCMKERNKIIKQLRKKAPEIPIICDCCKKIPVTAKGRKKVGLVLDHDPKTNEFRGWICDKCNKAIGMLGDDYEGLLKACQYLQPSSSSFLS